jgi:hypothetical protein
MGEYSMRLIDTIEEVNGAEYERTDTALERHINADGQAIRFYDRYYQTCRLQNVFFASEDVVRFGVENIGEALSPTGECEKDVNIFMHLGQKLVKQLLPYLQEFTENAGYISEMQGKPGFELSITSRGFGVVKFLDQAGQACSLQDSSLGTEAAIWFGVDNTGGSVIGPSGSYNEQVSVRMHLTQTMMRQILPYLQDFAETGKRILDIGEKE